MARTVSQTGITLPVPTAIAGAEVADSLNGGGWTKIFNATNTIRVQKRTQIVADSDPDGLLTANSDTVRYRFKVVGQTGDTETATPYIYYTLTLGGSADVQCDVLDSGGSTEDTNTDAGIAASIGGTWLALTSLDFPADEEYKDLVVTTSNISGTLSIQSIVLIWDRDDTTLSAGAGSDGFIPLEETQAAGEKPVSTHRLHAINGNLRQLYKDRVGQVLTCAYEAGSPLNLQTQDTTFWALSPQGVTSLKVWVYAAGDGLGTATVTVTPVGGVASTTGSWPTSTKSWKSLTFTVTPGKGYQFTVTSSSSRDPDVFSLCAYWEDGSYG
jgi:hypothetical protein